MKKLLFLLIAGLLSLPSLAEVGDKADFSSLEHARFYQGKVSAAELRGKVVFIEYWGLHCPPCIAAMPKLQELYARYKDDGFVLIASHVQGPNEEAINKLFSEKKLTFTSCDHFWLPQGHPQGGIPFSVLVGVDGKVVAMGHPVRVEPLVADEIKRAKGGLPILSGVHLEKYGKMMDVLVEGMPNIEAKVNALRGKEDDEEAQRICEAYDSWLELRKSAIAECREKDALRFVSQASILKKSVPSVTDFDAEVAKLTTDPVCVKLNDMRKKERSMRKKFEDGKKVSPKAVESMLKSLRALSSDDVGISASAKGLEDSLAEFLNQISAPDGKKPKASKKGR